MTDGVGRGNAFALAVGRAARCANDRVNAVAVALRIGQTLEDEHPGPLTHDKAVGTLGIGPGARRRQCADFAKLGEGRGTHIAVDAAGNHRIVVVLVQPLHGRRYCRHGRRAGGITHIVGAAQIEERCHATGDDVGQLARHGVFGNGRQALAHPGSCFLDNRFAQILRQGTKTGGVCQLLGKFGEQHPQRGYVVPIARHGVA